MAYREARVATARPGGLWTPREEWGGQVEVTGGEEGHEAASLALNPLPTQTNILAGPPWALSPKPLPKSVSHPLQGPRRPQAGTPKPYSWMICQPPLRASLPAWAGYIRKWGSLEHSTALRPPPSPPSHCPPAPLHHPSLPCCWATLE